MSLSAATSESPKIAGRPRLARWRARESVPLCGLSFTRACCDVFFAPSSTKVDEVLVDDVLGGDVAEAKEAGRLPPTVSPNEGEAPNESGRDGVAVELVPNESGLNASDVEPKEGVSPLNSNGMVESWVVHSG